MFKEFQMVEGNIPYLDTKEVKSIPPEVIDRYGETGFQQVFQRNIEREYIGKEAAIISVTGQCMMMRQATNIDVSITGGPMGGVSVKYPVEAGSGDTAEIQEMKEKATKLFRLDKADVKYLVSPEAQIVGEADLAHEEYALESTEQLAARIDNKTITQLLAIASTDNTVSAAGEWGTSSAKPEQDIATAIKNILKNSAVRPNQRSTANTTKWSLILPIGVYDHFNDFRVVDNVKQTLADYITQRWDLQILYSRAPLGTTGWPLTNQAILLPTMDRKIGSFRWFDGGGRVPSMFVKQGSDGLKVEASFWMNFLNAPNELDGSFDTNLRISRITGIA